MILDLIAEVAGVADGEHSVVTGYAAATVAGTDVSFLSIGGEEHLSVRIEYKPAETHRRGVHAAYLGGFEMETQGAYGKVLRETADAPEFLFGGCPAEEIIGKVDEVGTVLLEVTYQRSHIEAGDEV
jgi:hypothetical protein